MVRRPRRKRCRQRKWPIGAWPQATQEENEPEQGGARPRLLGAVERLGNRLGVLGSGSRCANRVPKPDTCNMYYPDSTWKGCWHWHWHWHWCLWQGPVMAQDGHRGTLLSSGRGSGDGAPDADGNMVRQAEGLPDNSFRNDARYSAGVGVLSATQTTLQVPTAAVFSCPRSLARPAYLTSFTLATEHPFALVRPRIFDKKSPENDFHTRHRRARRGHGRAQAGEEAGQIQQFVA